MGPRLLLAGQPQTETPERLVEILRSTPLLSHGVAGLALAVLAVPEELGALTAALRSGPASQTVDLMLLQVTKETPLLSQARQR